MKIEKNKTFSIEITGLTNEGQGIGKIKGFPVIVEKAIPGEIVEIKIIKTEKEFAIGKLNRIVKSSDSRIIPFCKAFKRCGGCEFQHVNYISQLKHKNRIVKECLKKIKGKENINIHNTIGMDNPFHYRNKAQYPLGKNKDGSIAIGFYAKRSHEVIEHDDCQIQDKAFDTIKKSFKQFILTNRISVYDEKKHEGLIRYLMARIGIKTREIMVIIVINGLNFPNRKELVKTLISSVPKIKSIILNINERQTSVILGNKNISIYGDSTIIDNIGDCRFEISPQSFYQVNPVQCEILYQKVLEFANLNGDETVFDLYCGIGTLSLFLSHKARKVYGVEVLESAIKNAKKNAKINNQSNVDFLQGKAEQVVSEIYGLGVRADLVVVDPPRAGCDEKLLRTIIRMKPKRVIYLSCYPETLARDLEYLSENGFRVTDICPVDMFPHSSHIECVANIARR